MVAKRFFLIALVILLASCRQKTIHRPDNDLTTSQINTNNETKTITKNGIFTSLIERSRIENKKIFLLFSFQACAWCRIFEKYHNDTTVNKILKKYIIIKMIDVNKTSEGSDLYKTYGKIGFPSWAIIDSAKNVIIDSGNLEGGDGNIGFPREERDIEYYIFAISKAAPSIKQSECDMLTKKLKEYRPKKYNN